MPPLYPSSPIPELLLHSYSTPDPTIKPTMQPPRHELLSLLLTLLTIHCCCIRHTANAQPVNGSSRHTLLEKLTDNYPRMGKFAVPRKGLEHVHVGVMPGLQHVVAVDVDKQSVTFQGGNIYEWRDDFLTWDPDEYQGLTSIYLPVKLIWTPDITITQVISQKCTRADRVVVSNTGAVEFTPDCINEIRCRIDITYFPFDKQNCTFDMASWLHDNRTLALEEKGFEVYQSNFDWRIHRIGVTLRSHEWKGYTYPTLTVTFEMQHNVPLFAFLLILPAALLSALTSVVFLLPSYNETKIEIGLSIFLSFMVLLNILMDATPSSSSSVPLLGYYFTVNSLLIAMSVFCSTIVLRIYAKSITHKNMSPRLKTLTWFMARIMRMRTERNPTDKKALEELTSAAGMIDTTSEKGLVNNDWVLLATVLDRFFFLIYLVINVTATLVIFIMYTKEY